MGRSVAAVQLGSEFNTFLFAPVGDEKNGMMLTVLSALARLDVDPWREASELARMPRAAANQRLTSLIAALPDAPSTWSQPDTIADRLIALLPRGDSASVPACGKLLGADAVLNSLRVARVLAINLLLLAGMLCPMGLGEPQAAGGRGYYAGVCFQRDSLTDLAVGLGPMMIN